MLIVGVDFLKGVIERDGFTAKAVLNARGAIFFPVTQEHRDQKAESLSYEDNYKGDALAAMLAPGRLEIRYHERFTDVEVRRILRELLVHPDLAFMQGWLITYQGRTIEL